MKKLVKKIPLINKLSQQFASARLKDAEAKYKEKFSNDCYGCFYGVFDSFDDAIRSSPVTKTIGYDCAELAQSYQKMLKSGDWEYSKSTIRSFDYPILYWLCQIAENSKIENINIFDFGGNVGIHFFSYSKYLNFGNCLKWTVCDLPEIIKVGKENNQDSRLTFTTNFKLANASDVFFTSGSIQYDSDILDKINNLDAKPKHLLINRLGLHEGEKIVTLQNGGTVFYPQYIFNKSEFIQSLKLIGYDLVDIWQDNEDSCYIPFHPEIKVPCYYGLYFKLNNGVQ